MKHWIISVLLAITLINSPAQVSLLDNPTILEKVKQCLHATYNFSFIEARELQCQLAKLHPDHPAPYFLKGLIIYWQNFPLIPEKKASGDFIEQMDLSISKASRMVPDSALYLEGIFFNLFGRAFKAMYWADNGRALKVLPDLRVMYSNTMTGFDLKDEFVEFYFSCGLYNYYIEAFPEANPIYKPLVAFMRDGDKELGLQQLEYAMEHSIYLKAESLLFMSLIHCNYEANLAAASKYALRLYHSYPRNSYYWGHAIITLLHQGAFSLAGELLKATTIRQDLFYSMIETLAEAFIEEFGSGKMDRASMLYRNSLDIASKYGDFGNLYKAIAYMGLSRIAATEKDETLKLKYLRLAESHTGYDYIINGPENLPL
ncbi:MAG: hypothetical protein JXR52_02170 [Bacteroidales bacterium]|nr:hypothetical protein [Bacteroidales bacterium]MBN2697606.1 hypothetical protein [Bacteroidales bacterium]